MNDELRRVPSVSPVTVTMTLMSDAGLVLQDARITESKPASDCTAGAGRWI